MTERLLSFALYASLAFVMTMLMQQLSAHGLALSAWHVTSAELTTSTIGALVTGLAFQSHWGWRTFRRQRL